MTEDIDQIIDFMGATWVDSFSITVVIFGFIIGLLHIFLLFWAGFHKYPITRLLLGNGIFIFLVALCRLMMLIVAQTAKSWEHDRLVEWCFIWKTGEVWSIGVANTCNAIMSLAYFRLIKLAYSESLQMYAIGKDGAAFFLFVLLLLVCTITTAFCMNYAGRYIINGSYCLAVGSDNRSDDLFALHLALCICCPALVTIGFFTASAIILALLNRKDKTRRGKVSSIGMGSSLQHLNNIEAALKYSIISWLCTNFLDIFWVIYYPHSSNSNLDGQYYLASAQYATLQNVSDFLVNLHYFILPRLGYPEGISVLCRHCKADELVDEEMSKSDNVPRAVSGKENSILEEPNVNKFCERSCN